MLSTQTASEPSTHAEPARDAAVWDTTFVRCIATLLIANSHLEAFYPRSWLAADGLLGNTLFFMISGLGLAAHNRAVELSFFQWYRRRVLRIYPSVWVCVIGLTLGAGGAWAVWTPVDYWHAFVWPTEHVFVREIMLNYLIAYVLLRHWQRAAAWAFALTAALAAAYALQIASAMPAGRLSIGTIEGPFWDLWWLLMFLAGMALPRLRLPTLSSGVFGWLLGAAFVLYVALKYAMVVGGVFPRAFLLLFAVGTLVAVCAIVAGAKSDWIRDGLASTKLGSLVRWVGGLSLEVYVTHGFVAKRPEVIELGFPLNVAVFALATAVLAFLTSKIAAAIRRTLAPG